MLIKYFLDWNEKDTTVGYIRINCPLEMELLAERVDRYEYI